MRRLNLLGFSFTLFGQFFLADILHLPPLSFSGGYTPDNKLKQVGDFSMRLFTLLYSCALAAAIYWGAGRAQAVLVGPDVTGFQLSTNYNYNGAGGYDIGSAGSPLEFTLDDHAGPWQESLLGSPVGNIGLQFTLHEFVQIEAGEG